MAFIEFVHDREHYLGPCSTDAEWKESRKRLISDELPVPIVTGSRNYSQCGGFNQADPYLDMTPSIFNKYSQWRVDLGTKWEPLWINAGFGDEQVHFWDLVPGWRRQAADTLTLQPTRQWTCNVNTDDWTLPLAATDDQSLVLEHASSESAGVWTPASYRVLLEVKTHHCGKTDDAEVEAWKKKKLYIDPKYLVQVSLTAMAAASWPGTCEVAGTIFFRGFLWLGGRLELDKVEDCGWAATFIPLDRMRPIAEKAMRRSYQVVRGLATLVPLEPLDEDADGKWTLGEKDRDGKWTLGDWYVAYAQAVDRDDHECVRYLLAVKPIDFAELEEVKKDRRDREYYDLIRASYKMRALQYLEGKPHWRPELSGLRWTQW